ncbi:MAG: transposase [Mucilaginibacter sp.]|jgi:transposase|uniref:IS110 family transposase n=1 Tax=Mucilaginibacter sp. TaxID=1882438 RepID=UPI003564421A
MKFTNFVGVDVSKLTIDAHVRGSNASKTFANNPKGFTALLIWSKKLIPDVDQNAILICFEHTGMYSIKLAIHLQELNIPFAMISPLEIKKSLDMHRGKSDFIDAKRKANYAWLHRDDIKPSVLPTKSILKLQTLLTLRDRLVRDRGGFEATCKEQRLSLGIANNAEMFEVYQSMIGHLNTQIKSLDAQILSVIDSDVSLKKTYDLLTSMKGIGPVIAANMITSTHNFTRFASWRKFACYIGTAPFEHMSGTSVRGKTQVSHLANKQLKKLLHLAAISAIIHNKELRAYYLRRVGQGKSKMSTINVLRNKILARMFALINRQSGYEYAA